MHNTQPEQTPVQLPLKQKFLANPYLPLAVAAVILVTGSGFLGYSIGHRQGLTVVGYDADAEQLVEVVQQQKQNLEQMNKNLNTAVQERDIAVTNSNDLYLALNQAKADQAQSESSNVTYRQILKERGGLSLTIQNISVQPLPDNAYEYQLDLVQVSSAARKASGGVEIRLIQGSDILQVPMESKQFNFDNSQRLTGRWTMPQGFSPQFIEVRLSGATPVIKRFSWTRGKAVETSSAFISEIPQAEANAQ